VLKAAFVVAAVAGVATLGWRFLRTPAPRDRHRERDAVVEGRLAHEKHETRPRPTNRDETVTSSLCPLPFVLLGSS
jgi:hypothetical protein